jgi:hypothetical protein
MTHGGRWTDPNGPRQSGGCTNWPRQKSITEVQGFLGFAGYYRRAVNQFVTIATPLQDQSKTTPEFRWAPQAQSTFEQIKEPKVRAPVLIVSDTSLDALYTDASKFAMEVVLLQDQGIGLQHAAYHARKMNKHEVHYYQVHEQKLWHCGTLY